MADSTVKLPPGYTLEDDAENVKLPPGYTLEGSTKTQAEAQKPYVDSNEGFLGGLWKQINPVPALTEGWKSFKKAVTEGPEPIDLVAGPLGPALHPIIKNIIDSHIEQAQKAKDAISKGNYVEGLGHVMATALPFVGPAAANIGETLGGTQPQFDKYGNVVKPGVNPNPAGAAGEAVGLAAPFAVAPVVGRAAGGVDRAADAAAESLTRRALKGGYTVNEPAENVTSAVNTMREQPLPLTQAGGAKIAQALDDVRKAIHDKVSTADQNGVTIEPDKVADRLVDTYRRYQMQVNPDQDLKDINRVGNNFSENNPGPIPAGRAQAMKIGSNILNRDKYGKVSTAQVEAEKALTRGLREELEAQIPELASLNAEQARFMNLDEIFGRAVNKYLNSEGFTGDLSHTGVAAAALRSVIANPVLKSRLAIAIDRARAANPGKFAAAGGSGMAKLNSLISVLSPKPDQQ